VAKQDARLAKIRDKLDNTEYGSGGGHNFWKTQQGVNVVRIIDGVGDMELFWQEVGKHWTPEKKFFYCLDFTTDGEEECPICEFVQELYAAGDAASKKLADQLNVQRRWYVNVLVRGDEAKGPQVYEAQPSVFKQIGALVSDPDYGSDVYDADEGVDLKITRTGTNMNTRYEVVARRKVTALADTDEEIDSILDQAVDLLPWLYTDDPGEDEDCPEGVLVKLLPYDRLKDAFEALDIGGVQAKREQRRIDRDTPFPDDEDGEYDDDEPRGRRKRSRRSRRR
jgi:hypothetical protein